MTPERGSRYFDVERFYKARMAIAQTIEPNLPTEDRRKIQNRIQQELILPFIKASLEINPNDIVDELRTIKKNNAQYSAPSIAATFITNQSDLCLEQFFTRTDRWAVDEAMEFAAFFDFLMEANRTASSILQAESALRGTLEAELGNNIDALQHVDPTDSITAFLAVRKKAADNINLLKQDPSGESLMHQTAESLKTKPLDFPFQDRNVVLQGASFAGRVYGLVYPLAERVKKGQA